MIPALGDKGIFPVWARRKHSQAVCPDKKVYAAPMKSTPHVFVIYPSGGFDFVKDEEFFLDYKVSNKDSRESLLKTRKRRKVLSKLMKKDLTIEKYLFPVWESHERTNGN